MRLLIVPFFVMFAAAASGATSTIKMNSIGYDPKIATVKAGDTVVWKNVAYTDHYATSDDAKTFDVGPVAPKTESKAVTFSQPGTYPYHCRVHGKTMSGTIVVQ